MGACFGSELNVRKATSNRMSNYQEPFSEEDQDDESLEYSASLNQEVNIPQNLANQNHLVGLTNEQILFLGLNQSDRYNFGQRPAQQVVELQSINVRIEYGEEDLDENDAGGEAC